MGQPLFYVILPEISCHPNNGKQTEHKKKRSQLQKRLFKFYLIQSYELLKLIQQLLKTKKQQSLLHYLSIEYLCSQLKPIVNKVNKPPKLNLFTKHNSAEKQKCDL